MTTLYLVYGRMNPPTIGHGKVLDYAKYIAGNHDFKIFLTKTHGDSKNPLTYDKKLHHVRKAFPRHSGSISHHDAKNLIDLGGVIHRMGYKNIVIVAGSDRVEMFGKSLKKYNGVNHAHGFYDFNSIKVVNAGDRIADSDGLCGVSASKVRAMVKANDYNLFQCCMPLALTDADKLELFMDLQKNQK